MTRAEAERLVDRMMAAREAMDYALARQTVVQAMVTDDEATSDAVCYHHGMGQEQGWRDAIEAAARVIESAAPQINEGPVIGLAGILEKKIRTLTPSNTKPYPAEAPSAGWRDPMPGLLPPVAHGTEAEACVACGKPWPCPQAMEPRHIADAPAFDSWQTGRPSHEPPGCSHHGPGCPDPQPYPAAPAYFVGPDGNGNATGTPPPAAPEVAPESGGREPGPRFRLEGRGVIDTVGGLSLCTGCGKLPPHAGCKAICAACSPPNGTCYCEGCTIAGKGAPAPSSPSSAQGEGA